MSLLFIILGLNIYTIFILKRDWLLQKKPYIILLLCNLILFAVGHTMLYRNIGNPNFVSALNIPAPQQILLLALLTIYRKIFHDDPADTLWSMDWKKMKDGIFNFIFFVASIVPTILALDRDI
jgi:hypothetical protein